MSPFLSADPFWQVIIWSAGFVIGAQILPLTSPMSRSIEHSVFSDMRHDVKGRSFLPNTLAITWIDTKNEAEICVLQ